MTMHATSSSSDAPSLSRVGQRQTATQQDTYMATQGCSCSWCSATRHNVSPVWRTMEHQYPWPPADAAVPFANQVLGADNPTGTAAMVNAQPQAQLFVPQVYDTPGYITLYNEARFPQSQTSAGLNQTQILDIMSVTDDLRRLAWRFVNNPESLVNVVRLEPGISGRFQVVIILEVANIL